MGNKYNLTQLSVDRETELPEGIRIRFALRNRQGLLGRFAWSRDWRRLASPSGDTIRVWDTESGEFVRFLSGHTDKVTCAAWSPKEDVIASASNDGNIYLWDIESGKIRSGLKTPGGEVYNLAWSRDGKLLAAISADESLRLWNGNVKIHQFRHTLHDIDWAPDGTISLVGAESKSYAVRPGGGVDPISLGVSGGILKTAWSADGKYIAMGSEDSTIRIWSVEEGRQIRALEGHRASINTLSFSHDGQLLASKAKDGRAIIWRCDLWEECFVFPRLLSERPSSLIFHPTLPLLATLTEDDKAINIWELETADLLGIASATRAIRHVSAKVVLVGESNVGKSCLAMRLAEKRYPKDEEHGTTHGMRFWEIQPEELSSKSVPSDGERRDIILWDMGGQDEYRLVHQLFLHDTTLALFLLDPTRGRTAFDEVEAWNKRLEKQVGGKATKKFLVGSKMDSPSTVTDQPALKRLCQDCGFKNYYEVSAKNGRGIAELSDAIANELDWAKLARTNRPELFQIIRDEIEKRRSRGEVVLPISELQASIKQQVNEEIYDPGAVAAVSRQLAMQGMVADTELATGERVLVLQIGQIERYAGSLIVAARNNPHGVPCLEEREVASPEVFLPGLERDRLPRIQERVVLECVVQLLVEHGICFQHEGLLIFPTLFRPTEKSEQGESFPHSISLYYDFSGAVDNIYASLIAWLVVGKNFGVVRLWEDRAEFEISDRGVCGVRKVNRGRGFAHIDVYFTEGTDSRMCDSFISFVEDHLRRHDIEIVEHLRLVCDRCGYEFLEDTVQRRIARGDADIGCPDCDKRLVLTEGAQRTRERDPELQQRTVALRTKVQQSVKSIATSVKQVFGQDDKHFQSPGAIRILHLSDLHFTSKTDVNGMLHPLVADIKSRKDGLGFDYLDYLVITGDLTSTAQPKEFERAQNFISGIISAFELSVQRCVFVPGNHDLSWEEEVYHWKSRRRVNVDDLEPDQYKREGAGYLIRNEDQYPNRFRNFSEYFYHPLVQREYPLRLEDQGIPHLFKETGIQFLCLNSSWQIDELFPERSDIHERALVLCLEKAEEQVETIMGKDAEVLRMGVWHHPISGNEKIQRDAYLSQLQKANVKAVLHGHVHEERADLIGYQDPSRIHVIGAGTFGALTKERPESAPNLYNLIEISRNLKALKVNTRWKRRSGGAWEGWGKWQGPSSDMRRTYYEVAL